MSRYSLCSQGPQVLVHLEVGLGKDMSSGHFHILPRKSSNTRIGEHCTCEQASQAALMAKSPPASAGDGKDTGSILGSGISRGGGHGNPLQYSCLENPMDRGAWGRQSTGSPTVGYD